MYTEKSSKAKQNTNIRSKKTTKIITLAVAIITVLLLIDAFTPIWGGQVKFYSKWVECGQRPFKKVARYGSHVASYALTPAVDFVRNNRTSYFCTAKEAEMTGLSSNPDQYEYPHLTQKEYKQMIHRSENQ